MGFFKNAQLETLRQIPLMAGGFRTLCVTVMIGVSAAVFQGRIVMAQECEAVWDDPAPILTVTSMFKVIVYNKALGQIATTRPSSEPQIVVRDVDPKIARAFDEFMSGLCLRGVKGAEGPPPGGPDDIEISFEYAEPIRLGRVRNTGGDFLILDDETYAQLFALLEKL